jgi:hypothetical protein
MPTITPLIETKTTTEYPTRYMAYDNPGVIWEAANRDAKRQGGYEAAVYYLPMPNVKYPEIVDGVYASIQSYQTAYWTVDIHATRPNGDRTQKTWRFKSACYYEAWEWLKSNLDKAIAWASNSHL